MKPIRFFALVPNNLQEQSHLEAVLGIIERHGRSISPVRFGHCHPLRTKFDGNVASLWEAFAQGSLLWRAQEGFVHIVRGECDGAHSVVSIELSRKALSSQSLISLTQELSLYLQPDLAVLHLLNEKDLPSDIKAGVAVPAADSDVYFGVSVEQLALGLPGLFWGMFFGRPYCSMFGVERLLSAPCEAKAKLSEDLVYLQLTGDILDVEANYEIVSNAKRGVAAHLGKRAFSVDSGLGPGLLGLVTSRLAPRFDANSEGAAN